MSGFDAVLSLVSISSLLWIIFNSRDKSDGLICDDCDSEILAYSSHIPLEALKAISAIYEEGAEKYGDVDNWKTKYKSEEALEERLKHAQIHLLKWVSGAETGEDDIAKVAWFCCMVIYMRERHGIELPRE
jgi:hypothetical protein